MLRNCTHARHVKFDIIVAQALKNKTKQKNKIPLFASLLCSEPYERDRGGKKTTPNPPLCKLSTEGGGEREQGRSRSSRKAQARQLQALWARAGSHVSRLLSFPTLAEVLLVKSFAVERLPRGSLSLNK